MFQLFKDFQNYRKTIKMQGKPFHVNKAANPNRHVSRILRILAALQKANISSDRQELLEKEFHMRKAQLAVYGIVLPDDIKEIEALQKKLSGESNG